jgi:hypothetical protein
MLRVSIFLCVGGDQIGHGLGARVIVLAWDYWVCVCSGRYSGVYGVLVFFFF